MKVEIGALFLVGILFSPVAAEAQDPFKPLSKSRGGINVKYERVVYDSSALREIATYVPSSVRVLVTTVKLHPSGYEYDVAEAFAKSLAKKYPITTFKPGGEAVRSYDHGVDGYDYVIMLGMNSDHDNYEEESTVYGARTTGVRCSSSANSVECKETSSISVPVGKRAVFGTIFTHTAYYTLARASEVKLGVLYQVGSTQADPPEVTTNGNGRIAYGSMRLLFGNDDYCDKPASAFVEMAKIIAPMVWDGRPEIIEFKSSPKLLMCKA